MLRWLCLICAICAPLAADAPTPRQCFETFIAAVLNTEGLTPEARKAELERCFDFEAWAADKEATDARRLSDDDKGELRTQWSTLLASDEFGQRWRQRSVTITEAPEPEKNEASLTIRVGDEARGNKFLVKLRRDAATNFWRWYAIVALDQKAGDNPAEAPRTIAQKLADIDARLAALERAEADLAAERAALVKLRRELRNQAEEERGGDAELGTPRALAEALARAMNAADWGAFVLTHSPQVRRDAARPRFDAQCAKVAVWTAKQATVLEDNQQAVLLIEVRGADNRPRMVMLRAIRDNGRWWINEEP